MNSQELQQLVIGSLGICSWSYDLENNLVACSDECLALAGYQPNECAVDPAWVSKNAHPEDLAIWRETFVSCVKGHSPAIDCELRFKHKDGHYFWIQAHGKVNKRDDDGRAVQAIGFVLDISQRGAAKQSESRYRLFLDSIPDAISLKNRDGHYLYVNRQFEAWLGKSSHQIYGKTADEIFPLGNDFSALKRHEAEVWKSTKAITEERNFARTEDGITRKAVITNYPIFDDRGRMLAIGSTNTDVSERFEAREAIRISESRFRRLFESAPMSMAEADWSRGKRLIENLRQKGVSDLKQHLIEQPQLIRRRSDVMEILHLNQEALQIFKSKSFDDLRQFLDLELHESQRLAMIEDLVTFANGERRSRVRYQTFRENGEAFPIIRVCELYGDDLEDWSRVLIVARDDSATEAMRNSEARYRSLFESAPVSLAECDLTKGKQLVDQLRAQGVTDLRQCLLDSPELLRRRSDIMDILALNREALHIFRADTPAQLKAHLDQDLTDEQRLTLIEDLVAFANGNRRSTVRTRTKRISGEIFAVIRESELNSTDPDDWSQVLILSRDASAEEAVRTSEIRYRRLFESAPAALYEADWSRGKAIVEGLRAQGVEDIGAYLRSHPDVIRRRDEVLEIIDCNSEALRIYRVLNKPTFFQMIEGEMTARQRDSLITVMEAFAAGNRRSSVRSVGQRMNGEDFPIVRESEMISLDREDWSRVLSSIHDLTAEVENANRLREYQQELRSLAGKISLAEASERRRISSELHDGTIQNLVLARIHIASLMQNLDAKENLDLAGKINDLLEVSLKETRSLIFEISPPVLYELGLKPAVEWLAEHYKERSGVEIEIITDKHPVRLSEEMTIVLFQAVRELLVNIAKHAQAENVSIQWQLRGDRQLLEVNDDGIGFDVSRSAEKRATAGGFGLFALRERLHLLGAEINIESSARGTHVRISAPLRQD